VSEQKHHFHASALRKENGLPDFIPRTFWFDPDGNYLTETKAQDISRKPTWCEKQRAAVAWCERVNELPAGTTKRWNVSYCLLGEALFYQFRDKGGPMEEILQFSARA